MKWLDKLLHSDEQTYKECVTKYNAIAEVCTSTQSMSLADRLDLLRLKKKINLYEWNNQKDKKCDDPDCDICSDLRVG